MAGDRAFASMKLNDTLKRQLAFLKFERCTPIQAMAIPKALGGKRDVMMRAPTGSGKTLAFLVPVMHALLVLAEAGFERGGGTVALVLSPTKELAAQTMQVAAGLARMVPSLVCGVVAGGEKAKSEKARLRKGVAVLCATPGRLAYHLEHTSALSTDGLRSLVLDEADRLLDMGFEPQIRTIHKTVVGERRGSVQTLLVSATLSPAVRRLAEWLLRPKAFWADAEKTAPGASAGEGAGAEAREEEPAAEGAADGQTFSVPATLQQWYSVVPCKERLPALIAALLGKAARRARGGAGGAAKAIVFFSSKESVDFHRDLLLDARWPTPRARRRPADRRAGRHLGGGFVGLPRGDGSEDEDAMDEDEEEEAEGGDEAAGEGAPGKIFAEVPLFKLHGSLDKEERAGHIRDFSRAATGVLLSTDAAARGLDFPEIDWIVQYDPPQRLEEYLHRVGRTARIGRAGNALVFLMPSEVGFLDTLRSRGAGGRLRELPARQLMGLLGTSCGAPADFSRERDFQALLAASLTRHVAEARQLTRMARAAFLAASRSYRTFSKELHGCFPIKELHLGHLASSFALRDTPVEAARTDWREGTSSERFVTKGKGKGKRKGKEEKGGGKGKGKGERRRGEPPGKDRAARGAASGPADEFAA